MFNSSMPSLADIAAVTGNNNDGFGGNNGWWVLIILFALFGGWGNNNGPWGGNGGGASENYVLASDFANLERKIDGVNNGLCDGFYAMNTGMLNGFNTVGTSISNLGYQLQQCCCDNRAMIADLKYDLATQAQGIMQNCNANYRSLHDEMVQAQMAAKDERIAALTAQLNKADLTASQCAQNEYLVSVLRPSPIPAYTVANPYCNCGWNGGCC